MNLEILNKFSKEDLIKFHLRQSKSVEFYRNKFEKQEKVGQIFFEGKRYNIIFEIEDETK